MKIVSVVEAATMNAVAKVVLEFHRTARELGEASGDLPRIEGSLITFDRGSDHQQGANEFVEATPKSLRLRKRILDATTRKRAASA